MSRAFGPKGRRDRLTPVFELPDHMIDGCADAEANRTASTEAGNAAGQGTARRTALAERAVLGAGRPVCGNCCCEFL